MDVNMAGTHYMIVRILIAIPSQKSRMNIMEKICKSSKY